MIQVKHCPSCTGELEANKNYLRKCVDCGVVWEIIYRDDRSW